MKQHPSCPSNASWNSGIWTSTLSITVDNTSVFKPTWINEKLVSTKAAGSGIGTESIRMIAEQYRGDARFEWKDGVFYASVMLNP
ncbi:MAG: GHKL domain-containing protein, partial [Lachnospiraceae bacterium]